MTIQIDMNIDMPDQISDATAAVIVDFLYALSDAVGNRYYGQLRRYHQDLRQPPPPHDDNSQLPLFPELDIPF